jgi:DNA-binding SARP family transcriptional activator
VEFELLGDVRASLHGRSVDVGHAKQRWVLAALLVDANQVVTADQLVDRVWGDRPPVSARGTLSTYLTRLRKALECDAVSVARRPGGYVLAVAPNDVDLHRFERLLGEARGTADDRRAADLYERAFALWRGHPLAGLDTPWGNGLRCALSRKLLAAERDHVDVQFRLGRYAEALSTLPARAAEHPLDERLAGQLMIALYGTGRLDMALAHYQEFRTRLLDELGADPAPALRELHHKILAGQEAVLPPAVERVVPRQLPARPGVFTGRVEEMKELSSRLDRQNATHISLISGGGGLGKTWLTLHWAHDEIDRFPDGQLYVNLRGFDPDAGPTPPSVALRGFLGALGVASDAVPADVDDQSALYRSLVAGRRMLVVLDNAAETEQVTALLPGSSATSTLVTSRKLLTGLLVRHGAQPVPLDLLSEVEGCDLLVAQLGEQRIDAEPAAVTRLLAHCGGLPLALGIVAARAAVRPDLPLADLADQLGDHVSRLDGLDTGESHLSLRAVLSWSYHALHPDAVTLVGLISLAPGADIGSSAVVALSPTAPDRTRAVLNDLEAANLVSRQHGGRFRMHDLVRLYAAERAGLELTAETRDPALRRLVDHYTHTSQGAARLLFPLRQPIAVEPAVAGSHPQSLSDEAAAQAWFAAEHQCLLEAQQTAIDLAMHNRVWQLAWGRTTFDYQRGHLDVQRTMWLRGLTAARQLGARTTQALAHRILGDACARTGRHVEAVDHLQVAMDMAQEFGDDLIQAHTHRALAVAWHQRDDNEQALEHAVHALRLYRAAGNTAREADALNAVAAYSCYVGDQAMAREHAEAALALSLDQHFTEEEGGCHFTLAMIASRTGRHADAVPHLQRALVVAREAGDFYDTADILAQLGSVHADLGDHDQARRILRQALRMLLEQQRGPTAAEVEEQLAALGRSTVDE